MKTMTKRTAVAALTGVVAVGMLTGCGEKKLDGTKTVATVDGTEIPLGIVSLSVREGQAQTEAMYKSFMGGQDYSIWSMDAEDGKTYGEQAVEQSLKDVELMYIMKEKAADYNVEVTDDDEQKIADAAAAFMAANSEETLQELAVSEDQVKTYLELQTYKSRMHDPLIADVDKDVSDEEAQQSSFDYVSISTADLSDDEIKQKKEDAQKILDDLKAAGSDGDLNEIAKSVDDSYSSVSGTFDVNEDAAKEDSDEDTKALKEKIAKGLADIFELNYEEVLAKVNSTSQVETIAKKVEQNKVDELKKWMEDNKITIGINIDEDTKRYYPYSTVASNTIGFCGNDNQGLSGIESKWDSVLTGTPGKIVSYKGSDQNEIPNSEETYISAENGSDLTLTIDLNIQTIVEKYLKQAVEDNLCSRGRKCYSNGSKNR